MGLTEKVATSKVTTKNILIIYTAIVIIAIYVPLATMVLLSFKSGTSATFPFEGFSLRHYETLIHETEIWEALGRSIMLGMAVLLVNVILVITLSLALRDAFPGRDILFYLIMLGIIIPGIVYAIGTIQLYKTIFHMNVLNLWTGLPAHVIWALPWGIMLMLARFDPMMSEYEQVARTLGLTGWQVFRKITFPLIYNQVLVAALFGFTLSFGELMRSLFVIGGPRTLPVEIFGRIYGLSIKPDLYALGTITLVVSAIILISVRVLMKRGRTKAELAAYRRV